MAPEWWEKLKNKTRQSVEDTFNYVKGEIENAGEWAKDKTLGKNFDTLAKQVLYHVPIALENISLEDKYSDLDVEALKPTFSTQGIADIAYSLGIMVAIERGMNFVINKPHPASIVGGLIAKYSTLGILKGYIWWNYGNAGVDYFNKLRKIGEQFAELNEKKYNCDQVQSLSEDLARTIGDFVLASADGVAQFDGLTDKLNFNKKKKKNNKGDPIDEAFKKYKKKHPGKTFFDWWYNEAVGVGPGKFSVAKLRNYAKRHNWKKNGKYLYPPYDGFTNNRKTSTTIKEGWTITRYTKSKPEDDDGAFASYGNVSFEKRALPKGKYNYVEYKVLKDISAFSGRAMAWFDQPGGSTQYQFANGWRIQYLIEEEYLEPIK